MKFFAKQTRGGPDRPALLAVGTARDSCMSEGKETIFSYQNIYSKSKNVMLKYIGTRV